MPLPSPRGSRFRSYHAIRVHSSKVSLPLQVLATFVLVCVASFPSVSSLGHLTPAASVGDASLSPSQSLSLFLSLVLPPFLSFVVPFFLSFFLCLVPPLFLSVLRASLAVAGACVSLARLLQLARASERHTMRVRSGTVYYPQRCAPRMVEV